MTEPLPGADRICELIAAGDLQRVVATDGHQWLDGATTRLAGAEKLRPAAATPAPIFTLDALRRRHEYIDNHETQVTATLSASEVDRALTQAQELVEQAGRLIGGLEVFR